MLKERLCKMFSFHRPKVYRSTTGCCICKAKSSSSRFTDSKKYEEDFLECFQLSTPRQGEICNACVLLVKRWKKLPAGSDRNWRHVVDARAGPGMKSMTKVKSKNKNNGDKLTSIKKKKKQDQEDDHRPRRHRPDDDDFDREYSPALSDDIKSDGGVQDVEMNDMDFASSDNDPSNRSSRTASPGASDYEEGAPGSTSRHSSRRLKGQAKRRDNLPEISGFVDLDFWTKEKICCGVIFKAPNGEVLVDPRFLKPCSARLAKCQKRRASLEKTELEINDAATKGKSYSDTSSDSGYDESSNQGAADHGSALFPKKPEKQQTPVSCSSNNVNRSITSTIGNDNDLMHSKIDN
ncbi:SIN3-HDAC complex-associated factor isoform X2 [Agrilus planipennis]|uniref:SIN3-HDAC complex-associated factor isoform X2 n=1 Tax=Agrilus planipennis TaxID=224129 RepID=A0A7F5RLL7_AGRPL|nr:SIN3-HDAC complex-associated factor isoform X2 [Agrilus planipennis]